MLINAFASFLEGPGHGEAIQGSDGYMYASGGSHGGDGGAESKSHNAPDAYGSFIAPAAFGSAGGDAEAKYKGLCQIHVVMHISFISVLFYCFVYWPTIIMFTGTTY